MDKSKLKKINNRINTVVLGMSISLICTFIALLILACVITYTSVPENIENTSITVINCISILVGSLIATKKQKSKGIIKGGLCGLVYIGVIYLLSSLISLDFTLNISSICMILFSIISGIIGGIFGINLRTN